MGGALIVQRICNRIGCRTARAVAQDGIAGVARPVLEVGAGGDAGLLVPAAAFGLRQRIGLGVVVEVVGAAIEQQVGAVEAAVLPGRAVLGVEDGIGERPVQQVARACEADDGGAFLVAGGGIGIPRREILAVDFDRFASAVQVLVAQDGADGEVVLRVGGGGVARADEGFARPVEEIVGGGEAGLVAGAVEADVEHVEAAVGAEDDGVVDARLVEVALVAGGFEDEFGIFVGRAVGSDGIGRSAERRRAASAQAAAARPRLQKTRGV